MGVYDLDGLPAFTIMTSTNQGKGKWEEPSWCVIQRSCLLRVGVDIGVSMPLLSKKA